MINVVVVDDSPLCRDILRDLLEEDGDIRVIGESSDGYQAITMVADLRPDVVTMDVDMPGVDGLETVAAIMSRTPVPILVVTGRPMGGDSDLVFRAMERGALDLLPKLAFAHQEMRTWIRAQVRTCATTPVFLNAPQPTIDTLRPHLIMTMPAPPLTAATTRTRPPARIAVLVAGTGGTAPLTDLIARLPADLACGVAIVQHGPMRFAAGFAKFLGTKTKLKVEVVSGVPRQSAPGLVLVPRDATYLACPADGLVAAIADADPAREPGAVKRIAVMLDSLTTSYRDAAIVAILSGIESDSLEGLAAVRDAGVLVVAEDPRGAARPELPSAAVATGLVERVLRIDEMARVIAAACSGESGR